MSGGLRWRRPADAGEAARLLSRDAPAPALTGSPTDDLPALARESLRAEGREIVSADRMAGLESYRPEDLTVTVGAGTRLSDLQARLRQEGQWLALSASALRRSAGGAVAAAPPSPFAGEYGPLRRQVLAVRVVDHRGERLEWGRAVMKNVAGFDLPRLVCGSRGRLGLLTRVTFRLWPLPLTRHRYELRTGRGRSPEARALPGATIGVEAAADWRPEAEAWSWTSGAAADPPLVVELAGSTASVEAREERLARWAAERGLALERRGEGPDEPPLVPGGTGDGAGRPPPSTALHFRVDPGYVGEAADALTSAEGARRVTALPRQGTLTARFAADRGTAELLDSRSWPAPGATAAVDRGPPVLHEAAEGRREPDRVELERRVVRALGGRDRVWAADFA